jgi:hypothetical protein
MVGSKILNPSFTIKEEQTFLPDLHCQVLMSGLLKTMGACF